MFCLWLSHRYRGRATFASLAIKQAKGRYGFSILIELRKLGKSYPYQYRFPLGQRVRREMVFANCRVLSRHSTVDGVDDEFAIYGEVYLIPVTFIC